MALLLSYLRQYWKLVALTLFLASANQIFSLLDPLIFRHVIDQYATRFKEYTTGEFFRGIGLLLAAAVAHVWLTIQLALENRRARPIPNAVQRSAQTTLAAKTMVASGLLLCAYVIYHVLHFTFGVTHPDVFYRVDALGRHDVYAMVVGSFQQWPVSLLYVLAMGILCLHLSHGFSSAFQSLGLNNERTIPILARIGRIAALLLFFGYSAVPLAVLVGIIRMPQGF